MPTFITIGYGDQSGYNRTRPSVRNRSHAHDELLAQNGARIGRAGGAVQVRNPEGRGVLILRTLLAQWPMEWSKSGRLHLSSSAFLECLPQ